MKKRNLLISVLSLVLLVGLVIGVMSISASAADSTVTSGDWLENSGKTLVKCPGGDCTHENCYAYSFAVVGDTQNLNIADVRDNNVSYMATLYNWILENKESKNIQYVMGLGDITQAYHRGYSSSIWIKEWINAADAVSLLDGKIDYSLVRGNHDLSDAVDGFNGVFGAGDKLANGKDNQYYEDLVALTQKKDDEGRPMAGFRTSTKIEDSYRKIEIGDHKYIIFTLDWHPTKADDISLPEGEIDCLTWVGNVLGENYDYKAIITLHSFLWYDGSLTDDVEDVFPYENLTDARKDTWGEVSSTGGNATPDELWNVLKGYSNVEMILCGHVDSDDILTTQLRGDNGNTVTCMLIDGQTIDSTVEPVGLVAMFYVKPDGTVMNVEYISTVRDAANKPAFLRANNQFEVTLDYGNAWTECAGATIPTKDYNTYTFQVVLDDDSDISTVNTYFGGYNTWEDTAAAIHAFNGKSNIASRKIKTWRIEMTKDYTFTKTGASHNQFGKNPGTTVLDLNGKTLTLASGTAFIPYYTQTTSYHARLTVENGNVNLLGSASFVVTQHGHVNATGGVVDLNLNDVDFTYGENATGSVVTYYTGAAGGPSNVTLNVTDCTFDASATGAVTILNLQDKNNNSNVALTVKGGSVKGSTTVNTTFVKQNYPGDTVKFIPNSNGNYTSFAYTDNTKLEGVYYSETENKYLEFTTPAESNGAYVSTLTVSSAELTEYGVIPADKTDRNQYPFLLFKDGVMIHAVTNWDTFIDEDTKTVNYQSGCTLLLRRDYNTTEADTSPSWYARIDDITIDLGGHTFTRGSYHMFNLFGKEGTAHQTSIVVKNGTIGNTSNTAAIVFNNENGNTGADTFNMIFEGVTFDISGMPTNATQGIVVAFGDGTAKGIVSNIAFNDCTIYRGSATRNTTLFSLIDEKDGKANNKTDINIVVNGGKLVANSMAGLKFATYSPIRDGMSASADTMTLGKGSDGKAFKIVLPSNYTIPTTAYGLTFGTHYLAKLEDNTDGTSSYTLGYAGTNYGNVTATYASVENYPFAVFYNGAFKKAYATFNEAVNAAVKYVDTASEIATCDTVYVAMRRDYAHTAGAAAINTARGKVVVDLQGYKLSSSSSYIVNTYINYEKLLADGATLPDSSYAYASNYLAFDSEITFKNGTIKNDRTDFGLIGIDTKNAHSALEYGRKSFIFNFEDVTLATSGKAIIQAFGSKSGTGHNISVNLNSCTLDFTGAAEGTNMFIGDMSDNVFAFNFVFEECSVIASKLDSYTLYSIGSDDTAVLKKGNSSVYLTVTQTTESVPTTNFVSDDGNVLSFVLASSATSKYIYTLAVAESTDYGTIPPSSVDSDLYPLVLFGANNQFIGSYATFSDAYTEIAKNLNGTYVLLLRRDMTKTTNKHIANFAGNLTLDLGGNTLSVVKDGNYVFDLGAASATGITARFTVKNGTYIKAGGRGLACTNYNSNLKDKDTNYYFTFENMTFVSKDNTYNTNVIFATWENGYSTATSNLKVYSTFDNCTFDYANSIDGAVMLPLTYKNMDRVVHDVTINSATILANSPSDFTDRFVILDGNSNGRADKITYVAISIVLPKGADAPVGEYSGLKFVKTGETDTEVTYTLSECKDNNNDHACDLCGAKLTDCLDENDDHKCDICGKTLSECTYETGSHTCNICGAVTECEDTNNDHNCEVCGAKISFCSDSDNNHNCDVCSAVTSTCEDTNNDHNCDTCGKALSECVDANNDHKCDVCESVLTECLDANNDHTCDVCGEVITACTDDNNDHACDICGTVSECADGNNDHACDVCGEVITTCIDDNNDHACDLCGTVTSTCEDTNSDHKCDRCGKVLTPCIDDNNDHACDICGTVSKCSDANSDHKCDVCGKTLTDCKDNDKDHACDTCGKIVSECLDENNDHKCDACSKVLTSCKDENSDHNCDTCSKVLTNCIDSDDNHECEVCGAVSECFDENNDHLCDICLHVFTTCTDEDKDHVCDICENNTDCVDEDSDNVCDVCGEAIETEEPKSFFAKIADFFESIIEKIKEKFAAIIGNGKEED